MMLRMSQKSILVLDDDPDIGNIFKLGLQKKFAYDVFAFTDPFLALEHFKLNSKIYGLVISDVRMPAMNGYEFAQQIKRIKSNVKIILMSAFGFEYCDRSFAGPLQNSDIDAFIEKPIPLIKLGTIVLTTLNNKILRFKPNVPLPL